MPPPRECQRSSPGSLVPDGEPQVLESHKLFSDLWVDIPPDVRREIDRDAEAGVCGIGGADREGKVLPFDEYLAKHSDFLDRIVGNRYAMPGKSQWKSDHRFIMGRSWFPVSGDTYRGKSCVDGIGVLMAYWWAIMKKAWGLRWPHAQCEADTDLAAQREEAWDLVDRAIAQMFGQLKVMTHEELLAKRRGNKQRARKPA